MSWDSSLRYDQDYAPENVESLRSSAVCYFASSNGVIGADVVTFEIEVGMDAFKSDLRAWRCKQKRKGKDVPQLSTKSLSGFSGLVLFGPETDPVHAVKTLRKMADLIEARGLVTGYGKSTYWEYEYIAKKTRST